MMRTSAIANSNQQGFTYLEALFAIALLFITAQVLLSSIGTIIDAEKLSHRLRNASVAISEKGTWELDPVGEDRYLRLDGLDSYSLWKPEPLP